MSRKAVRRHSLHGPGHHGCDWINRQRAGAYAAGQIYPIALALAGRAAEATPSVQRGFELEPGFRLRIFSEFGMAQAVAEKFVAGGRLLGLPE
jgi:hypothetical protein